MVNKRKTMWITQGVAETSLSDISSNQAISSNDMDDFGDLTVTRLFLDIALSNNNANLNDIAVGVIVVNENQLEANMPNPRTDADSPWLFVRRYYLGDSADLNSTSGNDSVHIDVHSQRKMKKGDVLVVVVDDLMGAYQYSWASRCLVKLA